MQATILAPALVFLLLIQTARGEVARHVQLFPIDNTSAVAEDFGRDRTRINSTSFKIQSIVTAGEYQFVSYYRHDGRLLIARRKSGESEWDIRVTQFTSYNLNDAHNVSVIGIDGTGYLHLSWGMHNNQLLYTRSATPVLSGEPLRMIGDDVGNQAALNTMVGRHEERVTYPNFYAIPASDDLLFNYRTGSSGNGVYRISRYDTSRGEWSFVRENWIESSDARGLTYNAYPHNLVYDSQRGLHASWTFRYNSDSPSGEVGFQTNHNLMYAYSPDDGRTWYRDPAGTRPYEGLINDQTAEVVVVIPEGSSLINTGTMAVDQHDRPAIATWWAPGAQANPPDHRRQYMFVWYDGQSWQTHQVSHRASDLTDKKYAERELRGPRISRPQLVFDRQGTALFVFSDFARGGTISVAISRAASRDDWQVIDLTDTDLGRPEPTIDRARFERDGVLSIFHQRVDEDAQNGGSPVAILDWNAAAYLADQ